MIKYVTRDISISNKMQTVEKIEVTKKEIRNSFTVFYNTYKEAFLVSEKRNNEIKQRGQLWKRILK